MPGQGTSFLSKCVGGPSVVVLGLVLLNAALLTEENTGG